MVQDDLGWPGEVWIRRKVFHMVLGAFFLCCMVLDERTRWPLLLILCFGIVLSMVQERRKLPLITWFLDRYDKKGDLIPGQGPIAFFTGALLVWFVFDGDIAKAAVIVLSFGDPMAYVMGRALPGPSLPWNRKKTVLGTVSFMVFPLILISLLWGPVPAVIVSISGALAESVPWPRRVLTDDNTMVPVISAFAAWIAIELPPLVA